MSRRDDKLKAAMEAQAAKREEAKERRRARMRKAKPWQLFQNEWNEEVWRVYGKDTKVSKWGPAECKLARKVLKDDPGVELDVAVDMAQRFIRWWKGKDREGLPPFKLFWAMRSTFQGVVEGRLSMDSLDEKQTKEREYDEDAEHEGGDFGWGI